MPTFKEWIAGRTAEGTPVDADEFYLRDDSGNVSKRVTWAAVKSTLGIDLKAPLADPTFTGNVVVPNADADTEALNRQTGDGRYVQQTSDDRVFVGAPAISANHGTPTLGAPGGLAPGWLLDASAQERLGLWFMPPQHWATFDVYLWGTNDGASSGDVVLGCFGRKVAAGDDVSSAAGVFGAATLATVTAGAENIAQRITVATGVTVTADVPYWTDIRRNATVAGDTLANDYAILGLELVRAS